MTDRIFLLIILLVPCLASGQYSVAGEPLSFSIPSLNVDVPLESANVPDLNPIFLEDAQNDNGTNPLRDAVVLPLNTDLSSSGAWYDLGGGDRVWKLTVVAVGALSIELYFDDFFMPPGGRFHVMDQNYVQSLGAYTELNNKQNGRFCTEMMAGDTVHMEYYEPASVSGLGRISLMDIGYRYRDVGGWNQSSNSMASDCQVDVSCPEGSEWSEVHNSIVRIRSRINGSLYWCTGTVMNNIEQDCRPLILTSMQTSFISGFQSTQNDFEQYRIHFGYESADCGDPERISDVSLVGTVKLADSNDAAGQEGSDFMLLECMSEIPIEYPVYYAGWNATSSPPSGGGASIHHPYSDTKKVASYVNAPETSGWSVAFTHWRVNWSPTPSGFGFMENGSTGAPLFDIDAKVIGTFTGGVSECNNTSASDFFGKFSWHWSQNPNPANEKLKVWLDPEETGLLELDGSEHPCEIIDSVDEDFVQEQGVYPNPSNGLFYFPETLSSKSTIEVYSITGELVHVARPSRTNSIDMARISPGSYLLHIRDGHSIWNQKVILVD